MAEKLILSELLKETFLLGFFISREEFNAVHPDERKAPWALYEGCLPLTHHTASLEKVPLFPYIEDTGTLAANYAQYKDNLLTNRAFMALWLQALSELEGRYNVNLSHD